MTARGVMVLGRSSTHRLLFNKCGVQLLAWCTQGSITRRTLLGPFSGSPGKELSYETSWRNPIETPFGSLRLGRFEKQRRGRDLPGRGPQSQCQGLCRPTAIREIELDGCGSWWGPGNSCAQILSLTRKHTKQHAKFGLSVRAQTDQVLV